MLRGAPVMVVASTPKEAGNGMMDLALVLSCIELAAPAMGMGTCWAGLLQGALLAHPPLKAALGIPEGHPHHCPMMSGYPKAKYFRLPERKPPEITWKSLENSGGLHADLSGGDLKNRVEKMVN